MTKPLAAFFGVSAAYWAFMLSDGALRMLVLLHFHEQGYTPVQLAYLFLLYEIAGIVTNLSAGWIAARFGLTSTLYAGLVFQIIALVMLVAIPTAGIGLSLVYVMCAQGLSGIAKDLSKMSAKSAVKLLAPDGQGQLFRWVALLTGSKNAIKGFGFFVGAGLLAVMGFSATVLAMAIFLVLILILLVLKLPAGLPQGKKSSKFTEVFSKSANINWLSAARVFLFGARDIWFVVVIPIYFYSVLGENGLSGKTAFFAIGAFMALWIIFYGYVQARAPAWLGANKRPAQDMVPLAARWALVLSVVPAIIAVFIVLQTDPTLFNAAFVALGLYVFGAIFAINSSLHSYLILQFSDSERVSMDVGFYYMANATGRFMGTLLSGVCYQYGGVIACLLAATLFLVISGLSARQLSVQTA